MEKQIAEGNIGAVGKYDFDFKEGKLCLEIGAAHGPAEASLVIKLDAVDVVIASLKYAKEKIPGPLDNLAIDLVIPELEKLKLPAPVQA